MGSDFAQAVGAVVVKALLFAVGLALAAGIAIGALVVAALLK